MKLKIDNIRITYNELNIMREFIELYQDIENACNEYNELCERIKKELNIQEEKPLIEIIEDRITKNILNRISTKQIKNELENEYCQLTQIYNQLCQYNDIIKINSNINKEILNKYFTMDNNRIVEYINSIYPELDEQSKRYEISIAKERIQQPTQQNIRILYTHIKELYEIYIMIYKYQNENLSAMEKIKLKKIINKSKNMMPISINALENFNEIEGPKIEEAIKKTKKDLNEIVIDQQITIITTPQEQYTKTKSA